MPVSIGTIISAAFYNVIQAKISNILGPTGYDGPVASSQVAVSSIDTAAQWNLLRSDINACRSIQTGSPFTITELPPMSVTQIIRASDVNLYEIAANLVVANYGGNLVLVNDVFADTRMTSWAGSIDDEVNITFASPTAANNFFQNNCTVRLTLSQTANSNAQDSLWVTNLANVGTIILDKNTTTRSGTAGIPVPIGWSSLTANYQMIFNGNRLHSGSSYTYVAVDDLYVYAKLNPNGNGLVIKTVMTNGDQGIITAGTKASFGLVKRVLDSSPAFGYLSGNNFDAPMAGSGVTPALLAYSASGTTTNATNVNVTSNVNGYAFIAVLPSASPAPTVANWPTLMYNVNTVAGVSIGKTVPLPNSSTAYKVYAFVEDQYGNASAVSSVAVTTSGASSSVQVGEAYGGGYYVGIINENGVNYQLIISPKSTGESSTLEFWTGENPYNNDWSAYSIYDGAKNTSQLNDLYHPACRFANGKSIGGLNDWYVPAKNEMELIYRNLKPTTTANNTASGANQNSVPVTSNYTPTDPQQTTVDAFKIGGAQALSYAGYWTSTMDTPLLSQVFLPDDGTIAETRNQNVYNVRLVRKVPL